MNAKLEEIAERMEDLENKDPELYKEYIDMLDDLNESWEQTLKRMAALMRGEE